MSIIHSVRRTIRNFIKNRWKGAFELGQRLGFDLLPRHWYSSIPDFREMKRDDAWRKPYDMAGVRGAEAASQFAFLESVMSVPIIQRLQQRDVWPEACRENGEEGYGLSDADLLWGIIASKRPDKIIQIGCGVSTSIILRAAREHQLNIELICVDPYPTPFLRNAATKSLVRLLESKAEHVDPRTLSDLNSADLLFIDSSHTTKPGSDVHHLILRVLPVLRPGVMVHVHDIHWPYDFSPNLFSPNDLFFGAEPALLHAYLIHNPHCRILASLSMLHQADPQGLCQQLPNYTPFASDRGLSPPELWGRSPSAAWLMTE